MTWLVDLHSLSSHMLYYASICRTIPRLYYVLLPSSVSAAPTSAADLPSVLPRCTVGNQYLCRQQHLLFALTPCVNTTFAQADSLRLCACNWCAGPSDCLTSWYTRVHHITGLVLLVLASCHMSKLQ